MIAFKTYAVCPDDQKPPHIPTVTPWQMQEIDEADAQAFGENGYTVLSQEDYDAYLAEISDELNAWQAQSSYFYAMDRIDKTILAPAQAFALQLMKEFAAENVLLGITQAGMTGVVLDKTQSMMAAIQSGSLYEVIARAKAIPDTDYDSTFITEARLLVFINKIETYLGIPLSETI